MYKLVIDFESGDISNAFAEIIKETLSSLRLPKNSEVKIAMIDEQHVEVAVKTPQKIGHGIAKLKNFDPQDVADFLEYQIRDGLGLKE